MSQSDRQVIAELRAALKDRIEYSEYLLKRLSTDRTVQSFESWVSGQRKIEIIKYFNQQIPKQ